MSNCIAPKFRYPLLTKELRKSLPPLYSGEEKGLDALALVKFFTPDGGWTWYGSEFDGEDLFLDCVLDLKLSLVIFHYLSFRLFEVVSDYRLSAICIFTRHR